jgi:hypothetical protein
MAAKNDVRRGRRFVDQQLGSPVALAITQQERDFIEAQAEKFGVSKSFLLRRIVSNATQNFTIVNEGLFVSQELLDRASKIFQEEN